jgi:hypothetical protein
VERYGRKGRERGQSALAKHRPGGNRCRGYCGVAIAACTVATEGICAAVAFEVAGTEFYGGAILVSAGIGAAEYAVSSECHSLLGYAEQAGIGALLGSGESVGEEYTPLGAENGAHAAPTGFFKALSGLWAF